MVFDASFEPPWENQGAMVMNTSSPQYTFAPKAAPMSYNASAVLK